MEAFEEVADTFSDCEGCQDYFSSRMGSLSLSFTSTSYDPAFTFDTSSDSSSLTQHSDSTLRSPAADALLPAPPLLTVVSTSPCATMRRAVTVIRRSSLPNAPATDPGSRICRPVWLPMCSDSGSSAAETASVPCCPENIRGSLKRRSCPEPDSINTHVYEMQLQQPQQQPLRMPEAVTGPSSSELLPPSSPGSPASSFASFAAALAAHYYADFGSVPDVPEHLEQVRQRTGKRQRMGTVEQLDDV